MAVIIGMAEPEPLPPISEFLDFCLDQAKARFVYSKADGESEHRIKDFLFHLLARADWAYSLGLSPDWWEVLVEIEGSRVDFAIVPKVLVGSLIETVKDDSAYKVSVGTLYVRADSQFEGLIGLGKLVERRGSLKEVL